MKLPLALSFTLLLVGCQTTTEQQDAPELAVTKPSAKQEDTYQVLPKPAAKPKRVVKLTPPPESDLWQVIEQGFQFEEVDNERVQHYRDWYLKHPDYMRRISKRAEPFLYLIVDEINKRNMPLELALLPVVESAFDPFAYSHGHASGMWQFLSATGKRFGLQQDWWYDGRRDVVASTNAALDYLTYLNEMMDGDWLHAIASYNAGEGRVLRAIKKNRKAGKPTDYWNLDLPKETSAYVPKLLALAELIRNNEQYHMPLPPLKNEPRLRTVNTGSQIDLAYAARLAGMNAEELAQLNPGFNRWATSPLGPHELLLPIENAEQFEIALSGVPKSSRVQWQRYQIKKGDTIGGIAQKFNTESSVIRSANNIKNNKIRAGKFLLIPASAEMATAKNAAPAKGQAIKPNQAATIHIVKSGDTLWDLAKKYNVKQQDLTKWNGLAKSSTLKIGQKLKIYSTNTIRINSVVSQVAKPMLYTIKSGDSLGEIAQAHKVSIEDLQRWNNIDNPRGLKPGQTLEIRVADAR
ncbi:LysM peptidoglycan-binding domain-containing protein [Motilimonas sp. E26]|uniref:LysM peptidoglycan-binding domain-containing protein n=1 Tax=Motilimonas TaxID=1914248 RepID=UPI001E5BDA35|nr:LysM peptidoglycan-binding domain-containing protein [Motilimonas sp. E26]MCE0556679.1 LysM peptidoglycan-binding domain-containing protein [Motilimonas sp. E26]